MKEMHLVPVIFASVLVENVHVTQFPLYRPSFESLQAYKQPSNMMSLFRSSSLLPTSRIQKSLHLATKARGNKYSKCDGMLMQHGIRSYPL